MGDARALLGLRAEVSRSLLAVGGAAWRCLWLRSSDGCSRRARWSIFADVPARDAAARYARSCCCARRCSSCRSSLHYYAAHAFGIHIPFGQLLTFLPVIFMLAALPVTVAHLGTTQAAWIFFFSQYAPAPRLLAFSLAAHLVFASTRALLGVLWLPSAYFDLVPGRVRTLTH